MDAVCVDLCGVYMPATVWGICDIRMILELKSAITKRSYNHILTTTAATTKITGGLAQGSPPRARWASLSFMNRSRQIPLNMKEDSNQFLMNEDAISYKLSFDEEERLANCQAGEFRESLTGCREGYMCLFNQSLGDKKKKAHSAANESQKKRGN
ncbi:hypothetical protein Tco_1103184 [Tanacetum coccineum]